jgi:hypothetical protein
MSHARLFCRMGLPISARCSHQRIAIEKLDGSIVAERRDPRDSFAGHQMNPAWDVLNRAHFNGEAPWIYLTTPFLLAKGWRKVFVPEAKMYVVHLLADDIYEYESISGRRAPIQM